MAMFNLHLGAVREVSSRDSLLLLDLVENYRKLINQVVLFAVFAKNGRHLLFQIADDVGVGLKEEKIKQATGLSLQHLKRINLT